MKNDRFFYNNISPAMLWVLEEVASRVLRVLAGQPPPILSIKTKKWIFGGKIVCSKVRNMIK